MTIDVISLRCNAFSELTDLVGSNIFADVVPEDADFPCVRYSRVSVFSSHHSTEENTGGMQRGRWQFDAYSRDRMEAQAVMQALVRCWNTFRGTIDGKHVTALLLDSSSHREDTLDRFRERVDFLIAYEGVD